MQIAVLSPADGWHFRDLNRAAAIMREQSNQPTSIIAFDFEALAGSISGAGREFNLSADVVFVRTMPAGSLEQIVFRMDLLQQLFASGVPVVNSPKCIEASVDKYLSLALISQSGVAVPMTCTSQSVDQAMRDFDRLGADVVVKPIFGSMGNGIVRITKDSVRARQYFEALHAAGSVIYQQAFVDHGGTDIRVLLIGDQVWAMRRSHTGHWITNISQGGTGAPYELTQHESEIARSAARSVGATIAGVDLVVDQKKQQTMVLEVNAAVGWKEISRVLKIDFARLILERLIAHGRSKLN